MPRVCCHLEQDTDRDYSKAFLGVGVEYDLICAACREDPSGFEANLRPVLLERFTQIEENAFWDWGIATLGQPEIRERDTRLGFEHEDVTLADRLPGEIADIQPVASDSPEWLLLTVAGELLRLDLARRSFRRLLRVPSEGLELDNTLRVRVSPEGMMVAVVNTRGRKGVVLDLRTGEATMRLDRGNYYVEKCEFPVAFFRSKGRLRLVHGTDWNRLDVSDPGTGELLTDRAPTSYRQDEPRPEHYLDYFHCGLSVSPGGERIADNGWVWHPAGVVTTWDLRRWVEANPWESEDGASKRSICQRTYYWDGPLCWIDDRRLAVWGYGTDSENLIPAVCLFDVESGRQVRWFAGPSGKLVSDGYLFSSVKESGTSVWDVETGERLLRDPAFCPTSYHHGAKVFLTALGGARFRLSRLVEQ